MERITYIENMDAEKACEAVSQNAEINNAVVAGWQPFVQDKRLVWLLKRLTRREQDVVWRRQVLKHSFADIGNAYHLTEEQVKHVYYYAISKMRRFADGI